MRKIYYLVLFIAILFTNASAQSSLKDRLEALNQQRLPTLSIENELPEDTLDLKSFFDRYKVIQEKVAKHEKQYKEHEKELLFIQKTVITKLSDPKLSQEEKQELLKLKDEIDLYVRVFYGPVKNFNASVNKIIRRKGQDTSVFSKISNENFAKIIQRLSHSLENCSLTKIDFDRDSQQIHINLAKDNANGAREYTVSTRLKPVLQLDKTGFNIVFERDASPRRGNVGIADAKFKGEVTQIKLHMDHDGRAKDLFLHSNSYESPDKVNTMDFLLNIISKAFEDKPDTEAMWSSCKVSDKSDLLFDSLPEVSSTQRTVPKSSNTSKETHKGVQTSRN